MEPPVFMIRASTGTKRSLIFSRITILFLSGLRVGLTSPAPAGQADFPGTLQIFQPEKLVQQSAPGTIPVCLSFHRAFLLIWITDGRLGIFLTRSEPFSVLLVLSRVFWPDCLFRRLAFLILPACFLQEPGQQNPSPHSRI